MKVKKRSAGRRSGGRSLRVILMFSLSALGIGSGKAWAETNAVGPQGGTVRSLVADAHSANTLYAGTTNSGVFKSIDGGENWSYAGLAGFTVTNLAIDSQNPNTIYATVALEDDDGLHSNGLFKSTNGGTIWMAMNSGLPPQCLPGAVVVDAQNSGTLYAMTNCSGLFKSIDGGDNWNLVNFGLPVPSIGSFLNALTIDLQKPNTLYVVASRCDVSGKAPPPACDSRVFQSTDGAENWREVTSATLVGTLIASLAIDRQNSNTLYARISWPNLQNGVARSTDGGKTWVRTSVALGMGCCTSVLAVDSEGTLYAGGSGGLFKSADQGSTWSVIPFFRPVSTLSALVFDPYDPGTIYAADDSGVSRSTDGAASWSSASSGIRAISVFSMAIDPKTADTLYAGVFDGLFKSTDRGKSWAAAVSGMTLLQYFSSSIVTITIDPQNPSNLYAGTAGDDCVGLFRSLDAGMTWSDHGASGLNDCVFAVTIDPQNPSTLYAVTYYRGLVQSTDAGESWAQVSGLPGWETTGSHVTAFALDRQNPQTLYVGVQSGSGSILSKSTDGGISWNSTALNVGNSISEIVLDPQNSSDLFAVTAANSAAAGGLWKSVDAGVSWQDLSPSLPLPVYAIVVNPAKPLTIDAATDAGVMTSTDGGGSWVPLNSNIGAIHFLLVDPKNQSTLYAGGPGGLFQISTSSPLAVTGIRFDSGTVRVGASYNATIAGPDLTFQTSFDVHVRAPGSVADIVVSNWQTGASASHAVPAGTTTGQWTITGVRAHQDPEDHAGSFTPVVATITVSP